MVKNKPSELVYMLENFTFVIYINPLLLKVVYLSLM